MRYCLLFGALLSITGAYGQKLPPFQSLRYNEDYTVFKADTNLTAYQKLKYRPLRENSNSFLSIGGEIRYQYFKVNNEDWGDAPKDKDGYMLSRLLLHTDLHTGNHLRFFAQLQGSMASGKTSGASPVDENPLDLHQLFFELGTTSKKAMLRLGRQELSYGSQRLISVRELPNNRQSFDAAKAVFSLDQTKLDAFFSRYVSARKGIFDDVSDKDVHLWGIYSVKHRLPFFGNLDFYYLGLHKKRSTFNDGSGKEQRQSLGTRIWGEVNGWQYDFEAVYQLGRFSEKQIAAWTLSSNTTYRFGNAALQPELGLKTEIISGDRQTGDKKLQTFNPLFPRGAYFGLAALIGPSNLLDIHPSVSIELIPDQISWGVDYDLFWRHSLHDGIYAPNTSLIYPSGGGSKRHIGKQLATEVTLNPGRHLLLRVEGTWFLAGPYLKEVGAGKDIFFLGMTAQFRF